MAKLHRMVRLNDRHNTSVFTFLLPPSVATVSSQDTFNKEFLYGHYRWTLSAVRGEQHLGVFVTLANTYDGMTCCVDFTVTLLNHDHYTKNEIYVERGGVFNSLCPRQGRKSFVGLTDLATRGFQMPLAGGAGAGGGGGGGGGWFQLELEMRNCTSTFEQVVAASREVKNSTGTRFARYETSCFSFSHFDWTVVLHPNGDGEQTEGQVLLSLLRQTSFDHTSRISYRVTLERAEHVLVKTDALESVVDSAGQSGAHVLLDDAGGHRSQLVVGPTVKGQLKIRLDLLACTTIAEVHLCPFNKKKNRAYLYDRDKQAWMLESDVSGDRLGLRLYYGDIRNIPRGHTRFVRWKFHVLPVRQGSRQTAPVECEMKRQPVGGDESFHHYYLQTDVDEGYAMTTNITTAQLNGNGVYLDGDDDRLTIQVEWLESHLLFHEKWQLTDNVVVQHKHQMWRELQALQAENYALEKQVHSYQLSIARNNAKWSSLPEGENDGGGGGGGGARGSDA